MRDNKHLKNNIYQKIFNHINKKNEEESTSKIKNKNTKYLLTSGNERKQNINEISIKKGHNAYGINDKIRASSKKLETEGNEDRKSFYMEFWRNKFKSKYLQKKGQNKFIKNNEDYNSLYFGANNKNITLNPKLYNYDSNNINTIEKRNMNSINIEAHKHNIYNTLVKRKEQKIILRHNNKFLDDKNAKIFLKNKNNIQSGNPGQDQLDFFQKFLIIKSKAEPLDKSCYIKWAFINK